MQKLLTPEITVFFYYFNPSLIIKKTKQKNKEAKSENKILLKNNEMMKKNNDKEQP